LSDRRFQQANLTNSGTAAVRIDLELMRFENVIQRKKLHGQLLREFSEGFGVCGIDLGAGRTNLRFVRVVSHGCDADRLAVRGQLDRGVGLDLE
jgi:hypothetical protein